MLEITENRSDPRRVYEKFERYQRVYSEAANQRTEYYTMAKKKKDKRINHELH